MCIACAIEPAAIAEAAPLRLTAEETAILHRLPPLPDVDDHAGCREWFYQRNQALGLACCKKCRGLLDIQDPALFRRGWCGACEATWLERRVLVPLLRRLGRRRALRRLRKLAR